MNWTTYLWFLLWLVISAAVYSLYSVHHVEVPYAPVDSPVQRCAFPCARAVISRLQRSEKQYDRPLNLKAMGALAV